MTLLCVWERIQGRERIEAVVADDAVWPSGPPGSGLLNDDWINNWPERWFRVRGPQYIHPALARWPDQTPDRPAGVGCDCSCCETARTYLTSRSDPEMRLLFGTGG